MAQQLAFAPPQHELPYYDGLFSVADQARSGHIGGKEAVGFLSRSKLPVDLLKNIWTMADNPKSNSLDRAKFHVAVRLIQLYQNGQKAQDAHLSAAASVNMRPAFFEGVSGVSVPFPGGSGPGQAAAPAPAAAVPQYQQSPTQQQRPSLVMQQQQQLMQQAAMMQQQPPSTALATQDPYIMLPHEQSRYETLFPQYETKKDGYVYGAEAVALFSKSGLEKEQLRDIWNMVDNPVDNRLDKLEFAIAMHLIVCISKKHLPVPPALPDSLQALKDKAKAEGAGLNSQWAAQQQAPPSPSRSMRSVVMPSPPAQPMQSMPQVPSMASSAMPPAAPVAASSSMSIPSPTLASQPASGMQYSHSPVGARGAMGMQGGMTGGASLPGPPPLASAGGMSISDAFEGLTTTESAASGHDGPPSPSPAAPAAGAGFGNVPSPTYGGHAEDKANPLPEISIGRQLREDANRISSLSMGAPSISRLEVEDSSPARTLSPPATKSAPTTKSYNMEDDNGELVKLRATLQKLQAENISLKAKLGDVSEEEREVRREINATIAEIGKLSQELTGLREKVANAKASLIEATAELKAQKEKKGMISDLIGDAEATLDALQSANESIQDLKASAAANEQKQAAAAAASSNFESDLFGFDAPTPAAAPVPADAPAPAPEPMSAPAPPPAPDAHRESEFQAQSEHYESATAPPVDHHYSAPAPAPVSADDFMGGAVQSSFSKEDSSRVYPTPAPMGGTAQTNTNSSLNADAFGHSAPAVQSSLSGDDIENMKQQAAKMDEIASEAEIMQRQLSERYDDLKSLADVAEALAKEKMDHAQEKKKKKFGGGAKKALKDAEIAKKEADEKRKQANEAQTELANAQAQAIKAKRAAEDMRQQAEQSELQAAAALSVVSQVTDERKRAEEERKTAAPAPVPPPAVSQVPMAGMGYGSYESVGDPAKNAGAPSSMGMGMGMGSGMGGMTTVMSGGDSGGIPSPSGSENGDAYSNPFGGF